MSQAPSKLKTYRVKHVSLCISVPNESYDTVLDMTHWPEGVIVRPFRPAKAWSSTLSAKKAHFTGPLRSVGQYRNSYDVPKSSRYQPYQRGDVHMTVDITRGSFDTTTGLTPQQTAPGQEITVKNTCHNGMIETMQHMTVATMNTETGKVTDLTVAD